MRHPTEGVLRRLLDEPAGVADSDRAHVAGCQQCLAAVATMRADAAAIGVALATDVTDVDVDAAWQRLSSTVVSGNRAVETPSAGRFRDVLRRPAVAGLAVAVVLTAAGTAAANDWVQIFRTEEVAPVRFSAADLTALPDLRAYGEVVVSGEPDVHEVANAAAAAAETGLEVPDVRTLPRGVRVRPTYQVGRQVTATFTFSADRAGRTAAKVGKTLPPPPPGLDGSQIRLVAGPGLAAVWSQPAGVPSLVVGRAVAPTAFSSGILFETARDYLLSLPGLPEDVAVQLRTFAANGTTLPLPIPGDQVRTSSVSVNGRPATVLAARDRTMAAVVWVDDGVVTAVAGALDTDEVLSVARELR